MQNIAGHRPLLMSEVGLDSIRNGEEKQADVLDWQVRISFASGCVGAVIFSGTDEWFRGGAAVDDWAFGLTDRWAYHDAHARRWHGPAANGIANTITGADLAYTTTSGQPFDDGGNARGTVGWQSDFWTAGLSGDYYDEEYFPANGLVDFDRYGMESLAADLSYYRDPGDGPFRYLTATVSGEARDTRDGETQNHNLWASGGFELREQQIAVNLSRSDSRYRPAVGRYIHAEEGDYQRLAYRRTVRRGTDIFVVYNEDPGSEQQFSVKLVWVLGAAREPGLSKEKESRRFFWQ